MFIIVKSKYMKKVKYIPGDIVKIEYGEAILVVSLSNKDEVMYVKSTIRVKPKNRKQKKEFKSQSYRMRKVAKGEYEVTTYCPFNVKLFSKIMSLLEKNENGEFWFNIDKK